MNPIPENVRCFLVDIDGTLTKYRENALTPEKLLHSNFLFPIIRDMMTERGWKKEEAEQAIRKLAEEVIFWDYSDFIAEFGLDAKEAFRRFRQWHAENLLPCEDGVSLVKRLHADGAKLFIMSNNPYLGCLFKLQAAGLADDDFSSPYFARIFGTNILRGCKCDPNVWKRAFAQIPADISEIGTVGDNPKEDRDIPASLGVRHSVILSREVILHGVETYQTENSPS